MKKIILSSVLFLFAISAFSQSTLVKISPFHLFDGTFYTSLERNLNNDRSIYLAGGYRLSDNGDDYGWMGELQIRKYLFRFNKFKSLEESPFSGVYGGLYANGKYFSEFDEDLYLYDYENNDYYYEDQNYEIKQGEGGVMMGIQLVFHKKLSLDFFVGGGLRSSEINGNYNGRPYSPERGYTGIVPKVGFDVGISF
jgi:hypothetical protein